MEIRPLEIADALECTPVRFDDERGSFFEWYRFDEIAAVVGHPLDLRQANTSISRRGVLRGLHFADVPPGQAKYVTVARGAIIDYVVDLRVGSPTFGRWDSVLLDTVDNRALYIPEGLGHAFVALEDDTRVSYLVSDVYRPGAEHGVNPLDPAIGLELPLPESELILSEKDRAAPSLEAAIGLGILPTWDQSRARYAALDEKK